MLHLHQLTEALRGARDDFRDYQSKRDEDAARYRGRLQELTAHTAAEVEAQTGEERAPGALPSTELDARRGIGVAFDVAWRSHEDARRWALGVLAERVTFAADGSQILPGRDISIPVAAVQVASFENPHEREGIYTKSVALKIISPGELLKDDVVSTDALVGFRRFALEVEKIKDFMERQRGWQERGRRMPLAFLDGTLQLQLTVRGGDAEAGAQLARPAADYVKELKSLVELSREARVPVVGYVDQSYARDLIVLLNTLKGEARHKPTMLFDAQLLGAVAANDDEEADESAALLGAWGARTIFFHCLRRGLIKDFVDESLRPLVGFVYMQTVMDATPARLDVPVWVHEAGLLDEVADAVRAECIVGNGYPYPIETADAAAVISPEDRQKFVRSIAEFSREEKLKFHVARKRTSKSARR